MRILINALSVTNVSGRHVLLGHLSRFSRWTADRHEFLVLHHRANRDLTRELGPNVSWIECPARTSHWLGRAVWESRTLPRVVRDRRVELIYTPSGTIVPGVSVPQVSFAQNPWALVPAVEKSPMEKVKAAIQRRAYARAMREAEVMVFNSRFMQEIYRLNAGVDARRAEIIYQGVNDETFAAADLMRDTPRKPFQIVSVSAMASHKGVETLVDAVGEVRRRDVPATLVLIGGWPDRAYRRSIERQIAQLGLGEAITIRGHVTDEELHRAYAESGVFCLMSWCESFGIPAVEAQAFGTPVVSSDCCAIPEVCGEGGIYPEPGRSDQVAEALTSVLTDDETWQRISAGGRENVERFRWDRCSRPYVTLFDDLARKSS